MRATAFGLLSFLMVFLAARGEVFFTFATTYQGEGQLFLLDADLLEVTPVGPAFEQPQYLGFLATGADGQLYGATAEGLVRIDPKTGAWTYDHPEPLGYCPAPGYGRLLPWGVALVGAFSPKL